MPDDEWKTLTPLAHAYLRSCRPGVARIVCEHGITSVRVVSVGNDRLAFAVPGVLANASSDFDRQVDTDDGYVVIDCPSGLAGLFLDGLGAESPDASAAWVCWLEERYRYAPLSVDRGTLVFARTTSAFRGPA